MTKPIVYNLTDPDYSGWCNRNTLDEAVKKLDDVSDYADDDEDEDFEDNKDYMNLINAVILPFLKEFNDLYSARKENPTSDGNELESNLRAIVQFYCKSMYPNSSRFFGTLDDDFVLNQMTIYVKKPKEQAAVDFLLTMADYIPEESQTLLKAKLEIYEEARGIVLGLPGLSSYCPFPKKLIRDYFELIKEKIASMDGKIKPPRELIGK